MPTFSRKPLNEDPLNRTLRRNPLLFGIPFVLIIVGASFAMTTFTQTRYDLQNQKQASLSKDDELGLKKSKRKIDIREEYYASSCFRIFLSACLIILVFLQRLRSTANQDWEPKRIERPKGVPDWGVPPTEPSSPPPDSQRK